MKYIFLFILLMLGLALSAQVIPPTRQPQVTEGLSEQAIIALRTAEDYLRQPGRKSQTADRSATLRLDSILTFGAFEQADSVLASRSDFTYPTAFTTVKTSLFLDVSGTEHKNRLTTTTNANGQLVSTFYELFHPTEQQWTSSALVEWFPHGNSQSEADSVLVKEWNAASDSWHLVLSIHHIFNNDGWLQETAYTHFFATGTEVFKDFYEYNAAGDNTVITFVNVVDGQLIPLSRIDRQYENHLMVEETLGLQNPFVGLTPERRMTVSYTDFGEPLERKEFKWSDTDWIMVQQSDFEYDTAERQIWETTQITTNGSDFRYKVFTGYREGDLRALTEIFHWDGNNAFLLIERDHYHYSEQVSEAVTPPVGHGILVVSPNPSSSFVTVPLEFTDTLQVYDELGNHVMQFNNVQYNAALDLSTLPSGSYVLRAVAGDKLYTGRVVKI